MNNTTGYFWLKVSTTAGGGGGASSAEIGSAAGKVQAGGAVAKGLQVIEGGTIRIDVKLSAGQTVASFMAVATADKADSISLSFYADSTDPKTPAQSFASQELAQAEVVGDAFQNWAKGGVVVLVAMGIKQP
jgi:hypothetical protein